ncbi:MAG: YchJ family protein [Treponema sp.]|nr:YchJ family protein [Treponema sp.]
MEDKFCPCGSEKKYDECCEPIIKGKIKATTAESLMRSRYSAYVKHEIDWIVKSCAQSAEENKIDMEETRKWSEESIWHGLKIIRTEKGGENDTEGTVEFSATYTRTGLKDVHLEQAYFSKKNGEWFYETGNLIPTTVVREGKKVGRNEPCPCGSGKKHKKCCAI